MSARVAGSARRAISESPPPACAQRGRSAADSPVEEASYGYWSAYTSTPSDRAASMAAITSADLPQTGGPSAFMCVTTPGSPAERATVITSSTAATRPMV